MSDENTIELSTRGKKQLRDVLYNEVKSQVNEMMKPMIENQIEKFLSYAINNNKIERIIRSKVEDMVSRVYWKMVEDMLVKADFQEKLKEEIIKYLHEKWGNGQVPFDIQLNEALKKALKDLINRK